MAVNNFGLSIDQQKVYREILDAIEAELQQIADRFIDIAKREVMQTTYGDAPGHTAWRAILADEMKKSPVEYENGDMVIKVGLVDVEQGDADWIGALIVTYGSGYKAQTDGGIRAAIRTRPGEEVWKDDLSRGTSTATSDYDLPDEFNQEGNMWLENTLKQI